MAEIGLGIRGLLRLVVFNPDFATYFDRSPEGARRSFWLAVPLLPPYLALQLPNILAVAKDGDEGRAFAAVLLSYPILWMAFPIVLLLMAKPIERDAQICGAITLYNWLNVFAIGTSLPILLLRLGGINVDLIATVDLATYIFYYVIECYAFRVILGANMAIAIALTVADFALSRILYELINTAMLGPLF